ncbi:hypothetical protein SUGI_0354380 [Cryptomeria japonica]|uniref:GEM-like protein 1 n=1 Tax=Cryptomeria japonica TaxID=3369 RepID=UPI0024089553|nr:GEM-like protein 1 [Cryptomeria japonica]XP_059075573.1 GEM-like protein 1 [Cryptomeria japonica]GLJ19587.1 hypothetical protein SUGI_0354380 [Cryptomeria japonica]
MSKYTQTNTSSASSGYEEGRWGTWVMGTPANPGIHPVNQQAANWVAQEATPSAVQIGSSTTTQQQQYMQYSGPPHAVTGTVTYHQTTPSQSNPYVATTAAPGSNGKSPMDMIQNVFNKWSKVFDDKLKNVENFAGNIWHHLRTGPSLTDTAMGRISQGTRVLTEGGYEKIYRQTFETIPGEQLRKSYACYLSTTTGPVIGTLYLSTVKLAFCSDSPLAYSRYPGQTEWSYYKVMVPLSHVKAVNPSANRLNPAEKYIQIITIDDHEFWLMGFVSHDKALKNLQEATRHQDS